MYLLYIYICIYVYPYFLLTEGEEKRKREREREKKTYMSMYEVICMVIPMSYHMNTHAQPYTNISVTSQIARMMGKNGMCAQQQRA